MVEVRTVVRVLWNEIAPHVGLVIVVVCIIIGLAFLVMIAIPVGEIQDRIALVAVRRRR